MKCNVARYLRSLATLDCESSRHDTEFTFYRVLSDQVSKYKKGTWSMAEKREMSHQPAQQIIVEIMTRNAAQLSLRYWYQTTNQSKFDLAESSRLWNMSVDSRGSLQTRTLDRYLNIHALPKNPRRQTVLQTAYYVLQDCPDLVPEIKNTLEVKVNELESIISSK